jgi:pilin isopeptide linkage protein
MKNKSFFRKLLASGVAMILAFAPLTASAAHSYGEGISGPASVKIMKYIVMDQQANVPVTNFTYTLSEGSGIAATTNNAKVFAGNDANATAGWSSVTKTATATFTTATDTSTTVRDIDDAAVGQHISTGTTKIKDPVTLADGKKYAYAGATFDLSGIKYKEPGIYRYIVTETQTTMSGISYDDSTRVLDVYVVDNNGTLSLNGFVLHNNAADAVVPTDGTNPTGKAAGFVSEYTSYDLTVASAVTGNQASRDEYFQFDVTVSGSAGTTFTVDLTNAQATTGTNGINTTSYTNSASLTVPANATSVTATYWLQNGQSIKVQGIASGEGYSVAQNGTTLDNEGYATTIGSTGDTVATSGRTATNPTGGIAHDTTVTFTNAKSGTIPTGIIFTVLPGIVAAGLGAAGFVAISKRRKEEE